MNLLWLVVNGLRGVKNTPNHANFWLGLAEREIVELEHESEQFDNKGFQLRGLRAWCMAIELKSELRRAKRQLARS